MQLFIELPARTCEADRSDFDHRAIHEPLVVEQDHLLQLRMTRLCISKIVKTFPGLPITTYTTDQTKTHTHTKSCKKQSLCKKIDQQSTWPAIVTKRKTGDSDWYGKLSSDYICLIEKTHHDSWFLTPSWILFAMFPKCPLGYLSTYEQQNRSTKLGLKSPVKDVDCNPEMLCITYNTTMNKH